VGETPKCPDQGKKLSWQAAGNPDDENQPDFLEIKSDGVIESAYRHCDPIDMVRAGMGNRQTIADGCWRKPFPGEDIFAESVEIANPSFAFQQGGNVRNDFLVSVALDRKIKTRWVEECSDQDGHGRWAVGWEGEGSLWTWREFNDAHPKVFNGFDDFHELKKVDRFGDVTIGIEAIGLDYVLLGLRGG